MMSTPAAKISDAVSGVIPDPPAAFSPFAITTSTPHRARSRGNSTRTALRPGDPTMSPMNNNVMPATLTTPLPWRTPDSCRLLPFYVCLHPPNPMNVRVP